MSDSIDVHRLRSEDIALARETIRIIKTGGESCDAPSLHLTDMQAWLSRSSNILIAATVDDIPVGFALGYLLDRVDDPHTMLFFYEIEVAPPYRKRGIGRRLVEVMKTVAREESVLKMWVQTHPNNIAARALYRRTGGTECADLDLRHVWTDRSFNDLDTQPS